MTIYEGITVTLLILGVIFIVYSILLNRSGVSEERMLNFDDFEEYQSRIEDINQKILEINEYSEFTKAELDIKHKELLFLYQLINEKIKEFETMGIVTNDLVNKKLDISLKSKRPILKANETYEGDNHNKQIIDLNKKGYSPSEIAKMLDIGQGQVKLVLDLYK